jgi:hypothetical protein
VTAALSTVSGLLFGKGDGNLVLRGILWSRKARLPGARERERPCRRRLSPGLQAAGLLEVELGQDQSLVLQLTSAARRLREKPGVPERPGVGSPGSDNLANDFK